MPSPSTLSDEGNPLLLEEEKGDQTRPLPLSRMGYRCKYWVLAVVLTCALLISIAFLPLYLAEALHNRKYICYEKRYSLQSLWDVVRYAPVQFHLEREIPSLFRGEPRPELDEAWANITEGHLILLSEDEMTRLGHTTDGAARNGDDYIALVEVFHHIHCVDFIRKFIFRDHYTTWNTLQGSPEAVLGHVDHCIDLLRQKVICDADVGLMAYSYDPVTRFATGRTSNMHMCRDFQAIRDWAASRRWDPEETSDHS